jgi:cell division protein FtsB
MEESLETLRARVAAKRAKLAELTKAVDDCNAETERLKNSNVEEGAKQDKLM